MSEHRTNEEFVIPGNDKTSLSIMGYNLIGGNHYNTNTIPVPKEILIKAGAVFILDQPIKKSGSKKEDKLEVEVKKKK